VKHAYESAKLKQSHTGKREKLQKSNLGFPSYEQWLIAHDRPWEAEAWRHRKNMAYLRIESGGLESTEAGAGLNANLGLLGFSMTETKQGLRFSRNDRLGTAAFVDTGRSIRVYGSDDETLLASLQLAAQKWGSIQLHGTEAHKKRCMELAIEHGIKVANPEFQEMKREVNAKREADKKSVLEVGQWIMFRMPGTEREYPAKILEYENDVQAEIEFMSGKKVVAHLNKIDFRILDENEVEKLARSRRISELDSKLNNPPYWIGSAGYPKKEAAADMRELVELESMNLYGPEVSPSGDESGGEISEEDAFKIVTERHPIILEIRKTLERGGIGR
jgi:hypothetical protein